MRKKLGVIILFNIIIISFLSVIYAEIKVNDMPTFAVVESVNSSEETKEVVKSVEAKTVSSNADFNFKSKSQILMEMSTGKVIYENNADEKSYPASVTKIMTVLLIMEAIDSSKISYNDNAFNEYYDAILYCVFVALGFACFENLLYVYQNGISILIIADVYSL